MWQILFAGCLFVGAHLGVSSTPLRGRLVSAVGERGYLGIYSLLALTTLVYLIWMYGEVPRYHYLWLPAPTLYWVAKLVMPIAFIFLLGGFMVKNPTAVGMEGVLSDPEQRKKSISGLLRITRHFAENDKPLASICHGIEILAMADVVRGRRCATIPKCRFDLEVCGGTYADTRVVVDGSLVSARGKRDSYAFMREYMKVLNSYVAGRRENRAAKESPAASR